MSLIDSTIGQNPLAAAAVAVVNNIIQRVWPDPAQQAAAQQRLLEMQQTGDLEHLHADVQESLAQIATNTAEASNPSVFVAGWRPALGWVCSISLGAYYIPRALLCSVVWIAACWHAQAIVAYPSMDTGDLIGLISTMLGSSVIRTVEKRLGVDTKQTGT